MYWRESSFEAILPITVKQKITKTNNKYEKQQQQSRSRNQPNQINHTKHNTYVNQEINPHNIVPATTHPKNENANDQPCSDTM